MAGRVYITKRDMAYKNILADMKLNGRPVFILSVETTGLDKFSDELINIHALKCHFEDKILIEDEEYNRYIRNTKALTPELEKITKITNEFLMDKEDLSTVMEDFYNYIGEDANIIGFNTSFLLPMLKYAGFETGWMLDIRDCFDLRIAASSTMEEKVYSLDALSSGLVPKKSSKVHKMLALFNQVSESIPTGTEHVSVTNIRFWQKAYTCRYLYLMTNLGEVGLNCNTGFWVEREPGFFDAADIDGLTRTVCEHSNSTNIWDFIKKYAK